MKGLKTIMASSLSLKKELSTLSDCLSSSASEATLVFISPFLGALV
jgi:hypothetical protein